MLGQTNNIHGRPLGRPNKLTKAMKEVLASVVEGNASKIQLLFDDIAEEDPAKAVELWLKMASFIIPKPRPEVIEEEEDKKVDSIEIIIRDSKEEPEEFSIESPNYQ